MLNKIIHYSLHNRLVVLCAAILLLIAGTYTAMHTEVDVFPDLNAPTVVIMTEANGMAAEEVEQLVTFPVETAVNGATGVRRVRSSSTNGFSVVWVEFDWGTDIYLARQIVSEKLAVVSESLPVNVGKPTLGPQSSILGEMLIVGLTADSTSMLDLRTIADWTIRPRLLSTGGVAQVAVLGGDIKEYQIQLDPERMRHYGVSMGEVMAVTQDMNLNANGGVLYEFGNEYIVRGVLSTPKVEELGKAVVKTVNNFPVTLEDIAAGKQLKIIDEVFSKCDSIIVATDAGREGELIFRWIYSYLGYTKPFRRLWISSLTDEAIREGMANLREGSGYDSLYAAADSRAKADWLVGMNASRALATASGSANNSIGRVQTPTLAMICARFKENRNFVSTPYWQLHIALKKDDVHRQFFHPEDFRDKNGAEAAYRRITSDSVVTINKVERKTVFQQAPLLYDLTALQKDCNIHHDLSADKTLSIAQSLYEKKLVSYPRTGSRYIPEDVMAHVPALLEKVITMPWFREYGRTFDLSGLNTRSVDATKVTDHHALIVTGVVPEGLSEAEAVVYEMIAGRMLEAFSPRCEKESLKMECVCEGMDFRSQSAVIVNPGWRAVFSRKEDREKDEPEGNGGTAVFAEGEEIPVMGYGLAQKKTLPRPLYTEATLLTAMENCGKEIADGQAREAVKELGIGTPATRAAIITTLFKRDYIARSGKSIVPTEKGLHIYDAVKDMLVADVSLTGSWEKTLLQIERHTLGPDTFMASITDYTRKATREILNLSLPAAAARTFTCPKCKTGHIIVREKSARCDNKGCGLTVYRRFLNKELTDQHLEQLFSSGSTRLIKGFKGKKGVAFDASVTFDAGFTLTLSFPKNGNGRKRK